MCQFLWPAGQRTGPLGRLTDGKTLSSSAEVSGHAALLSLTRLDELQAPAWLVPNRDWVPLHSP